MARKRKALVISDGKIGHQNQSLSLCRIMGWESHVLPIQYAHPFCRVLSIILELLKIRNRKIIRGLEKLDLTLKYDLLICAGSRTYYAAKILCEELDIPSIAIMNPGIFSKGFSVIIMPEYENKEPAHSKVIKVPFSISVPDEKHINQSINELHSRVQSNYQKSWGIIIGGNNKTSHLPKVLLQKNLEAIIKLKPYDTALFVTSSRRSGKGIEDLLLKYQDHFGMVVYSSRDSYNPIPAFTQVCERIFVTSDSSNMISEIVTSGNAFVEILMNRQKFEPNKFLRFISSLCEKEAAHVFVESLGFANKKLDTHDLVEELKDALGALDQIKNNNTVSDEG